MTQVHQCKDDTELTPLYPSRGLFLKPIARMNVSVHYPELKQALSLGSGSGPGGSGNAAAKSVSSWDIMERIKGLVSPEEFISLKVVKNTLEFIRFEGELENRVLLKKILQRLDGKTMKVTGFKEQLKIRTCESKLVFPSKYDWDSFFRDAKNMNEMKAGERPDTIHFQNLPVKWFTDEDVSSSSLKLLGDGKKVLPSEKFFRKVWEGFGDVRAVDIPACDPYRTSMSQATSGIKTFAAFSNDNAFEGYVQYKDYMSFVKAMDALRGSWIFHQERGHGGKSYVANIKVDFDKSKHLSDESIRKRKMERDKLAEKDKAKKHAEKLSRIEREVAERKKQEIEKKESEKALAKIEYKISMEERKYMIAQRKLEAIRLLDYLFEALKKQELLKGKLKSKGQGPKTASVRIKPKFLTIRITKPHKKRNKDATDDLSHHHRKERKLQDHKHKHKEKVPHNEADSVEEVSSVDEEFVPSPKEIYRSRKESPRKSSRSPHYSDRKSRSPHYTEGKPGRSPHYYSERKSSRSPHYSGRKSSSPHYSERKSGRSPHYTERKSSRSPHYYSERKSSRSPHYSERKSSKSPDYSERKTSLSPRRKDLSEKRSQDETERPRVSSSVKVVSSSIRYVGDWEVKAKSTLGSQVQVSTNYVPVGSGEGPSGSNFHHGTSRSPHRLNPDFPTSFYRGRGGPRGRFFRGGPPPPYRGRGRGGYMRGSFNPNHSSGPPHRDYHQHQEIQGYRDDYHHSAAPYRGRGRGYYHRGGNRDGYHHRSDEPDRGYIPHKDKHSPVIPPEAQTVHHDYAYLEELDRAYEKYFSSITRRNES